jgi:hypothetical protein
MALRRRANREVEENMKRSKHLIFLLVAMAVLSIGSTLLPVTQAQELEEPCESLESDQFCAGGGGAWGAVCCGPRCGGDYCLGSGTYTCCK